MDSDEDMDIEPVFEAHEIDIEYEYEASMFFDFTREETRDEALDAEIWFESAKSYPPSRKYRTFESFNELRLKK